MKITFKDVTLATAGVVINHVEIGYVWIETGEFNPYRPLRTAIDDNTVDPVFLQEINDAVALFMVTTRLTS